MTIQKYRRKIFIVDRKFQFKYIFVLLSLLLISVFTVSFTTFYMIWNQVIDEFFFVPEAAKKMSHIFLSSTWTVAAASVVLGVLSAVAGVFLSHRIAGPIYRVKKVAEQLKTGDFSTVIKFRKDDDLQELADAINEMINGIRNMISEDRKIIEKLDNMAESLKKKSGGKELQKEALAAVNGLHKIIKKLKNSTGRYKI